MLTRADMVEKLCELENEVAEQAATIEALAKHTRSAFSSLEAAQNAFTESGHNTYVECAIGSLKRALEIVGLDDEMKADEEFEASNAT